MKKEAKPKFWVGQEPLNCDACDTEIIDEFSDCRLGSTWGNFCPRCVKKYQLVYGKDYGQRYTKQADGEWMKTAG